MALYSDQSLSTLELPVNPKKNEYAFYLVQEDRKDTLIFSYYSETIVLSPECGAYDYLKGLALTRNTFDLDSAKVLNNQLIRSVATNVEIYF